MQPGSASASRASPTNDVPATSGRRGRTSRDETACRRPSRCATIVAKRSPYSAVPTTASGSRGIGDVGVHVVERRAARRAAQPSAAMAARSAPRSSRCAESAAARRRARVPRRRSARARRVSSPSSVEESNSSCMPRQMPSSGVPAATRSASSASRPYLRRFAIPAGNAPTPGSTSASACSRSSALARDAGRRRRRARAPSRPSAGCPCRSRLPRCADDALLMRACPWCSGRRPRSGRAQPRHAALAQTP